MLSLLSTVSSTAYNLVFGKKEIDDDRNPEELAKLEKAIAESNAPVQVINNEKDEEDEKGCFYATGKVTTISENYVIIDNKYYCDQYNVFPTNLAIGNKVRYLAYQLDENQEIKVSKIVNLVDLWEETGIEDEEVEGEILAEQPKVQKMITKTIVQKVERREQRLVYAGDVCIDLDKVSSEFVPLIGDWIKITSLVSVNPDPTDVAEDILEVQKIEPLRSKLITGKISNFDTKLRTGSVDKKIVFHKGAISVGYVPCVGDTVICDSIESDQNPFIWRAILVMPVNKMSSKLKALDTSFHGVQMPHNISYLQENKHGIDIATDLSIELDINETKEININVTNTGFMCHVIVGCYLSTSEDSMQLSLLRPHTNDKFILNEGERVVYTFKCQPKFVGKSMEIILFQFKHFEIVRTVVVNVRPKKCLNRNSLQTEIMFNRNTTVTERNHEAETRIPGIRPFKFAPFAVSNGVMKVPEEFWKTVVRIMNSKFTQKEAEVELTDALPVLSQNLTFQTYRRHFHNLLFLEEIAQFTGLQFYNMDSVILQRSGEFLSMDVPGLAEKRPSLIVGDKIIVRFKWDSTNGNKSYEGFIHVIKNTKIFVKFNVQFHETYNGEDCKVSFEGSTTVIQRCHRAINAAATNLGETFLFPNHVVEKEPQYVLKEKDMENRETEEEIRIRAEQTEPKQPNRVNEYSFTKCFPQNVKNGMDRYIEKNIVDYCKTVIKTRKLGWFNKRLNKYQKEAVKNILLGIARPLPYVIFGPPGTGKTITLCETILQIYSLVPDSRILIATPSNSSANLIAQRLLDYGILKPGDLVRLVANYYITNDAIPESLLPYCAVADLTSPNSNHQIYSSEQNKKSYNSTTLGRHRITIGTCAALGILHNLGFKPGHFTHVLVDEAGQATEPEVMIPLSYIKSDSGQVILAGDPLQLGPCVLSKYAQFFGYGESFLGRILQRFPYQRDVEGFEHGYDPRLVTKLLINYRSLPEILGLPNQMFYDLELIPHLSEKDSEEAKMLLRLKDMLPYRVDSPPSIVFHGVNGVNRQDEDSPSWYNLEEATQVYIYFLQLCERGFTADDIGIITPYKKQVNEIRFVLSDLDVDLPKIGTVEEFQGQERNVIILSTVRSISELVEEDMKFTLGFVSMPQRLNVAITRARTLLIIIGNPSLLSQDSYWRFVLDYCTTRDCYTGCNLRCTMNRPIFEKQNDKTDFYF